jgi:hypothetical protein
MRVEQFIEQPRGLHSAPSGRPGFAFGVLAWISTCAKAFVRSAKRRKNKAHQKYC